MQIAFDKNDRKISEANLLKQGNTVLVEDQSTLHVYLYLSHFAHSAYIYKKECSATRVKLEGYLGF